MSSKRLALALWATKFRVLESSMQHEYRPGLATLDLVVEVRRLLATERQTERLICRYLADLADRVREGLDHTLWGYGDELHAASCIFGLGVRDTRERVRVGRALRAPRRSGSSSPGRSICGRSSRRPSHELPGYRRTARR